MLRLWVACWLLFAPAAPAGKNRSVLVLYSNHRLLPANLEFEAGLRETLTESTELSAEFLDYPRFDGESYARALTRFLREEYALRPPAVLVVGAEGALDFVLRHRAELRQGNALPVVFLTGYADVVASVQAMKAGRWIF